MARPLLPVQYTREALQEAWTTLPCDQLPALIGELGLGSRLLSDVSIRQGLVRCVRIRQDLPDSDYRIRVAMGNLSMVDQNSQKSWWEFVKLDTELVKLAVQAKLHTRYMLPSDTAHLFSQWMEIGGGFHKAAQVVWDQVVSSHSRPFVMEGVLDPTELTAEHWEHWKDRILNCWEHAPATAKAGVITEFLIHGTTPKGADDVQYRPRRKWIARWAVEMLDGSASTHLGVEQAIKQSRKLSPYLDDGIIGLFQGGIEAAVLHRATPLSPCRSAPRL